MQYGYSNIEEYEVNLRQRAQDFRDAQADGQLILAWLGIAISWVGRRLVIWGQWLQPLPQQANAQSSGR